MRRMSRAGGVVEVEGLVWNNGIVLMQPANRIVGQIGGQVIALLRCGVWLYLRGVAEDARLPLRIVTREESIEVLETKVGVGQGWDKLREETFARQKKLGILPANAELTPRPPELPAWDTLSADEHKLLARQAEISSAYIAYTDFQLGHVLGTIREEGHIEDTVVFYIAGDNGAVLNSKVLGTDAYDATGKSLPVTERLKLLDQLGGPLFNNLYGAAWGWADNTPFQYGKGIPAYLGGARDPMVVSWPGKIVDKGSIRTIGP